MSVQDLNETNGHLIIKNAEGGTGAYSLLINVTGLDNQTSIDMKNDVSVDGQKNGYAAAIGKVMFNFGNYSGTVNYNGNNEAGVILAPNATLKFSTGHHAGSVYAKNVESSVEIHQIMFQPAPAPTPTPSPETGSLKIVKTTTGGTTPNGTEFVITGPNNYSKTVKYSEFAGGPYELSNLPVGEYTVTENADSAKLEGYTLAVSGDNGAAKDIENVGTAIFQIVNTYSPTPVIPDKPITPDKPTNPDQPTNPDKPTNPDQPTNPDKPITPTTPDRPANPATPMNPDKPTTPDKPTNPDKPTTPDKPTNPTKPAKPNSPSKPNRNGSFPQTGDNSNLPLYAAAFAVSAVGLGVLLIARRKKNHKVK